MHSHNRPHRPDDKSEQVPSHQNRPHKPASKKVFLKQEEALHIIEQLFNIKQRTKKRRSA
jgi:hypothetical protein